MSDGLFRAYFRCPPPVQVAAGILSKAAASPPSVSFPPVSGSIDAALFRREHFLVPPCAQDAFGILSKQQEAVVTASFPPVQAFPHVLLERLGFVPPPSPQASAWIFFSKAAETPSTYGFTFAPDHQALLARFGLFAERFDFDVINQNRRMLPLPGLSVTPPEVDVIDIYVQIIRRRRR